MSSGFSLIDFLKIKRDDFFDSESIIALGDHSIDDESIDDRLYVSFSDVKLQFIFELDDDDDFYLSTVFLERCDYIVSNMESLLGLDISFDAGRDVVRSLLGEPKERGKFGQKTILGVVPPWDKYFLDTGKASLHFQYSFDSLGVDKITLQCE
ncbi:MAG: hypothetical protein COA42_20050 [Alteromonadaceae bacterium]|nr:MAG: hypothetical protein COA42_20050 [Alteromonadaceae bacterium]